MPFGLQIVDTPGMIDLPANDTSSSVHRSASVRGRGYNFVEVVRWWAKRADLILLLFDPDKPGTTGETLEVLTKSLAGLNHKFLVVLNKVDQLDNSVDFARAYGALGWALSKVISRKDIPQIYTMYNAGFDTQETASNHKLPLEAFAKRREEVTAEVLRACQRHFDNVVTAFEETLRQVSMVSTVLRVVRGSMIRRELFVKLFGLFVLASPVALSAWLLCTSRLAMPTFAMGALIAIVYAAVCVGVAAFLVEYLKQSQMLQAQTLNDTFEATYSSMFIHDDGEDYRSRWLEVRSKIASIIGAVDSAFNLPYIAEWEITRIEECLEKDTWYLRQLARQLREKMENAKPETSKDQTKKKRRDKYTDEMSTWD